MAKRKRGRKRMIAEREPNGRSQRPSAIKQAEQNRAVVVEARQRVWGLTAAQARQEEAASVLGRLCQSGELHPDRRAATALYVAGKHFEQVRADYLTAIAAKRQLSGGDIDGGPAGFDSDDGDDARYVKLCRERIEAWQEMRREILESDALAMMACECVIVEDKYAPSLYGPLRCGLNAIARMMQKRGLAA